MGPPLLILQTDPFGYQDQMNLYGYVGNDPGNATDPSGMYVNYVGGQVTVCLGVCVTLQIVRAYDYTTKKWDTLVTFGGGVGLGEGAGVVGGSLGEFGDNTNMGDAKGPSSVVAADTPGGGPSVSYGSTKGPNGKTVVEVQYGPSTGGLAVLSQNTVTLEEAENGIRDAISDFGDRVEQAADDVGKLWNSIWE